MKQCSVCKIWKKESYFYPSHTRGKLQSRCKACKNAEGEYQPRDESLVPANLLVNSMTKGAYVPERMFSDRPGALDHVKVGSLRIGKVVNQYEDIDGLPKLRSIATPND